MVKEALWIRFQIKKGQRFSTKTTVVSNCNVSSVCCYPGQPVCFNCIMKIGCLHINGNLFLAPMAGITDAPLRSHYRDYGCALCFTEMISSEGLVRGAKKTLRYLERFDNDTPFAVQLFGSDPSVIAAAAQLAVEKGAQLIDINMGCPARKIIKNGAGSALMRSPDKVKAILKHVRASVNVPLTIKIRSGWKSEMNAAQIAVLAQEQGVDAVIVHPRTVEQGFTGRSDWQLIKKIKQNVSMPVIGNGDIVTAADALAMLSTTGCDAVMIGRGAIGCPWIFRQIPVLKKTGSVLSVPDFIDRRAAIMGYTHKMLDYYGPSGVMHLRIRLSWYAKGLNGAAHFRKRLLESKDHGEVMCVVHQFFGAEEDLPK